MIVINIEELKNKIFNENCISEELDKGMNRIPDKSIDMILCDLPYGTTTCKWDTIIPFDKLWKQYKRTIKDNGAIVLFADEPFTSNLIMSNIRNFKYRITWDKIISTGFLNAKKMPLKVVEDICVFYKKPPTYNPQMVKRTEKEIAEYKRKIPKTYKISKETCLNSVYGNMETLPNKETFEYKYPTNLLKYNRRNKECNTLNRLHPTQKPVELLEWLIKTYSNEGNIILDNCIGSGSTAIACMNTNRNYIGFELDNTYYDITYDRIEKHKLELNNTYIN